MLQVAQHAHEVRSRRHFLDLGRAARPVWLAVAGRPCRSAGLAQSRTSCRCRAAIRSRDVGTQAARSGSLVLTVEQPFFRAMAGALAPPRISVIARVVAHPSPRRKSLTECPLPNLARVSLAGVADFRFPPALTVKEIDTNGPQPSFIGDRMLRNGITIAATGSGRREVRQFELRPQRPLFPSPDAAAGKWKPMPRAWAGRVQVGPRRSGSTTCGPISCRIRFSVSSGASHGT